MPTSVTVSVFSDAGSSISGIPPKSFLGVSSRETKYSTSILCRNSSGVVPVRVRKPVVQVRITPAIIRAVVQVAEAKNGCHCAVSPYNFEIVVYKLHLFIVKILRGVPLWSMTIHPHYDAALRPHLPVAERRAA